MDSQNEEKEDFGDIGDDEEMIKEGDENENNNNDEKEKNEDEKDMRKPGEKQKRRSKNECYGRDYKCGCGKEYLSYPALYTHINIYMENFSKYLLENQLSNANYIKEGLNALLKKKRKRDINEISTIKEKQKEIRDALDSISSNIKLKFNFKTIKFVAAYER